MPIMHLERNWKLYNMKRKIFLFLIVLFSHQIFAQTNFNALYLQTYRQAIDFYNNQEYGKALKYAEDSIVYKKDLIQSEVNLLVNSLAPKEVSSVGEKIDNVLKILTEREDKDAIDIINKYLKLKGYDFFQDSISNLLDYIKGNIDFPEADKLIGDVYKIDTEYEFAKYYYEKALKKSEILNIPNEKYEILYMLADIEYLQNNFSEMEKWLLMIIAEDNNYKNKALQTSLVNTINKNNKKAVEDFFKLYRADGIYCIQAYDKLSSYYKENNQTEKSLFFSSLSVLTIFSRLYDYIEKRESDFKYTDFASFLKELTFHQDLLDWCDEMSFWKKLNEFSRIVAFSGNNEFSKSLLRILMKNIPVEYYQKEAVLLLEQSN